MAPLGWEGEGQDIAPARKEIRNQNGLLQALLKLRINRQKYFEEFKIACINLEWEFFSSDTRSINH